MRQVKRKDVEQDYESLGTFLLKLVHKHFGIRKPQH